MQNKDFEEFSNSAYKTDGEGNELTVYDCLNRKERRKLWRETKRTGKKNKNMKDEQNG